MCLKIGEFVLLMIWACMGAGEGVAMPAMDNLLSRYSWHQSNACSATLAWYDLHCAMCCPAQWLAGRRGKHKAISAMMNLLGRGILDSLVHLRNTALAWYHLHRPAQGCRKTGYLQLTSFSSLAVVYRGMY